MRLLAIALLFPALLAEPAERVTSDYEIAAAREALERARSDFDRLAAHLNLGDLHAARSENAVAREHYESALEAARAAATEARAGGNLDPYGRAVAWTGLALAKLDRPLEAIAALEEALRYLSDEPKIWNLYASAMDVLDLEAKAESAARNAVTLATDAARRNPSSATLLDLAVYRYTLASALLDADPLSAEGGAMLEEIAASLDGPEFERLRREIREVEKFEVFSSARGDAEAWLAVRNRALLRLGLHHEARGDAAGARAAFERVLERRSDDPAALAALARLARSAEERERWFAEAFAANPYVLPLIHQYGDHVRDGNAAPPPASSPMQHVVALVEQGEISGAAAALAQVPAGRRDHPAVRYLKARIAVLEGRPDDAAAIAEELGEHPAAVARIEQRLAASGAAFAEAQALLATARDGVVRDPRPDLLFLLGRALAEREAVELRAALDAVRFSVIADFDSAVARTEETTTFATANLGATRVRFQTPATFRGSFAPGAHRLEFRVLGAVDGELLVEPLRLEVLP
ncbi:MAG: hypothetical protein ACRD2J_09230 [Thermoanaerobaculia bacterium]